MRKTTLDPLADVAPPVAEMSSHPKAAGTLAPMTPLIQRRPRYTEVVGELGDDK